MPSAFIHSVRSYPAVRLASQLARQRYVPPNPLVLGRKPLKYPAPATDRDRPVSRRSKPSSRTAFIGEQPNPWELLHPQDAMSRHRTIFHDFAWCRLYLLLAPDSSTQSEKWCVVSAESARVGVLPVREPTFANRAFPFGSVVTGSFSNSSIDTYSYALNRMSRCSIDRRLPSVSPGDGSYDFA